MLIGVLALQGSVKEHCEIIQLSGDTFKLVRDSKDLENIDGLIIPGGESTTLIRLLKIKELDIAIKKAVVNDGLKVWGTCAGLILLSKELACNSFKPLGLIDIKVDRNSYGTQLESFETDLLFKNKKSRVRFIRAPKILSYGDDVNVICRKCREVVAVETGNIMVTTFHPEVTCNRDFYNYFTNFIKL